MALVSPLSSIFFLLQNYFTPGVKTFFYCDCPTGMKLVRVWLCIRHRLYAKIACLDWYFLYFFSLYPWMVMLGLEKMV
jgi:hypothetical protein